MAFQAKDLDFPHRGPKVHVAEEAGESGEKDWKKRRMESERRRTK